MHYLLINHSAPLASNAAQATLELAIAFATFEHKVQLLFMADGVLQLVQHQQSKLCYRKDFSKTYQALTLYGIDSIFVEEKSLLIRNLQPQDLLININLINEDGIAQLMQQADIVLTSG